MKGLLRMSTIGMGDRAEALPGETVAARRARREKAQRNKIWGARLILVVAIVALWQIASGWLISDLFIGRPSQIALDLWSWALSGKLFYHAGITSIEALLGFLLGSFVG